MLEVRTHEGVPDDPALEERWTDVVDADPLGTVFATPRYLRTWAGDLAGRAEVLVHEVVDGDRTVGIVPVALERQGSATGPIEVVRFAGGTEVTDYVGAVAAPEHRAEVAAACAGKLADDADWDELVLGGLVEGSGWREAWEQGCADAGITHVQTFDEAVCPRIDLSDGYGAWLEGLGGKQRHEMKRKARKLARDAGELELVDVPPDEQGEALERFFGFNVDRGEDKGDFFADDAMRSWFHRLSDELAGDGTFRLHELRVGGLPGAACVSLVGQGEWGLYNSAFDETLAMLAPGMVIVGMLVEQAAEEGCRVLDLLRGDEEYKYRFGPTDRRLLTATFERT